MVTIIIAVLGFAFKQHQVRLVYLSFLIVVFFYTVESMWHWRYMHKYILRYNFLREYLNRLNNQRISEIKGSYRYHWIDFISIYDLTNEAQQNFCDRRNER